MIIESILRDRIDFFAEIRDRVQLFRKNFAMLLSSVAFLGIYGAVMGISHSIEQAASSSMKLPFLFIVTLLICTPSLYFFNLLFGSRHTLGQTIALVLTAMTTTAVLLMSFAPVTLFFLLTTSEYTFFKLLNVAFFAVSGVMGVLFLRQGMVAMTDTDKPESAKARRMIFFVWVLLYSFVGSQMAWTLSPFVGDPDQPFILFRQIGGNFYADVFTSLGTLLGLN
jgi:hypothetical protein